MVRTSRSSILTLLLGLLLAGVPLWAGQATAAETERPASRQANTARSVLSEGVRERRETPMRMVFVGSSTTYGVGASIPTRGYVDRVLDRLQLAYPTRGQQSTAVSLGSGVLTSPGIQAYNGGRGGRTSADYLDYYLRQAIADVQPTCVFHMVGSNDSVLGMPPLEYEANMLRAIRQVDSIVDRPVCHVLVHTFRRNGVDAAVWAKYGQVLARIAEENPRAIAVNASRSFDRLDARGSDPFDLIGPDTVHPTDAGHSLLARRASAAVLRKVAFGRLAR